MKAIVLLFCIWMFPLEVLPPTNAKIVEYVKGVVGKKVGRGECWDLANEALTYANAKWEFPTKFGRPIDYKKDKILAGDLIQINNVVMENKTDTSIVRWKMVEHTAIVYATAEKGKIKIAEQNVNGVRKVMLSDWDLNDVKSGKLQFYRPQPN
ncbi:MAG: hypothetical protein V4590_13610 [Bacteroidota bacterium]